jgi:hypothetical protein
MGSLAYLVIVVVAGAASLAVAPELVGFAVLGLGLLLVLGGPAWAGGGAILFGGLGLLEIVAGEEARDAAPGRGRRAWWSVAKGLGAAEAALAAGAAVAIANVL